MTPRFVIECHRTCLNPVNDKHESLLQGSDADRAIDALLMIQISQRFFGCMFQTRRLFM